MQFNIEAGDQRVPEQFGFSSVTVQIDRDTQGPSFFTDTYRVTINETEPVNKIIIKVSATDPDLRVSTGL